MRFHSNAFSRHVSWYLRERPASLLAVTLGTTRYSKSSLLRSSSKLARFSLHCTSHRVTHDGFIQHGFNMRASCLSDRILWSCTGGVASTSDRCRWWSSTCVAYQWRKERNPWPPQASLLGFQCFDRPYYSSRSICALQVILLQIRS